MERDRIGGYVASLEQIVKNAHLHVKETVADFQEMCQLVAPDRNVPHEIIVSIRRMHKEIQDELTKIKGVQQLLQAKYRQYYRRDPVQDREIMEFASLAKNFYFKFEYVLKEIEAKKRLRDGERILQTLGQRISYPWFRSKENQVNLIKNLQRLSDLAYAFPSDLDGQERRVVAQETPRSLSLFVYSGEREAIEGLQSRVRLRKHDIVERFGEDELRGALTHLHKISTAEVEKVIRRFTEMSAFPRLKCLLFSIRSQDDFEKEAFRSAKRILQKMGEGEVRTIPF